MQDAFDTGRSLVVVLYRPSWSPRAADMDHNGLHDHGVRKSTSLVHTAGSSGKHSLNQFGGRPIGVRVSTIIKIRGRGGTTKNSVVQTIETMFSSPAAHESRAGSQTSNRM
jgi:hypothetical protein